MKNKLIFIDFDNTLLNGETTDYMNIDDLSDITSRAMSGEIDYYNSLVDKTKTMKGFNLNDVTPIIDKLKYNLYAKEFIEWCHNNNYYVIVLSGGFDFVLEHSQKELNYDIFFCNYLRENNNILTGEINGPIMETNSKGTYVKKFQRMFNIDKKMCISIGDGANDISMFKETEYSFSFCGKQIVSENATYHINKPNFRLIRNIIEKNINI